MTDTTGLAGRDLRATPLFAEAERLFAEVRFPGENIISDSSHLAISRLGDRGLFVGSISVAVDAPLRYCLCEIDLLSGAVQRLRENDAELRHPQYAPDGSRYAFLAANNEGGFDLQIGTIGSQVTRVVSCPNGWAEHMQWAADSSRLLVIVADSGSHISGGEGGFARGKTHDHGPDWLPTVEFSEQSHGRRRPWICDVDSGVFHCIGTELNCWDAVWAGPERILAVVSDGSSEDDWYTARLAEVSVLTGRVRFLYEPNYQLGVLAADSHGRRALIVDALCSDRKIVAGAALLIDCTTGESVAPIIIPELDITQGVFLDGDQILLAGHWGPESVVGLYQIATRRWSIVWHSAEITTAEKYVTVAPLGSSGDFALIAEGFDRAPEIGLVRAGQYATLYAPTPSYTDLVARVAKARPLRWTASDGRAIDGWLLGAGGSLPAPTVMVLHGGPVWHWRPTWLGRPRTFSWLQLLHRGFNVFLPNPRGSTGRGIGFVEQVYGDMGGADMHDCLAGLDHLIAEGAADAKRLGVTGISYGGFMTALLVTQDSRFGAAVAVSPVTNWVSQHLVSNIPSFVQNFLNAKISEVGGRYYTRSPVTFAARVTTPTLVIAGALDQCTPPGEAIQFFRALAGSGCPAALAIYPGEGHGVATTPAAIDYSARLVGWFEHHLKNARQAPTSPGER